jgi:hypothetical protein
MKVDDKAMVILIGWGTTHVSRIPAQYYINNTSTIDQMLSRIHVANLETRLETRLT